MIIGEVRRYLRDNNAVRVSRSMRDTAYKAIQVREQLSNELNREPTINEISEKLEMNSDVVVIALESIVEPISLYEPVYNDGGEAIFVMDQIGDKNTADSWMDEILLKDAIRGLSDREKRILNLRFMLGKTQTEVAEEVGISQAQVSRLEKGALKKIKSS
jgi:RNA polymerase sporulation-specific sigma factor